MSTNTAHSAALLTKVFWQRVKKTPTCWLWLPGLDPAHGTPVVKIYDEVFDARDAAYLLVHGERPAGTERKMACGNPRCVNPEHLVKAVAVTAPKPAPAAPPNAVAAPPRVVAESTKTNAERALEMYRSGLKQADVAAQLGISQAQVSRLLRGLKSGSENPRNSLYRPQAVRRLRGRNKS